MKSFSAIILMAVLLVLISPRGSSSFGVGDITPHIEIKVISIGVAAAAETKPTESIYTRCPELSELPLIPGHPVPCVASYSIDID